MAKNIVICCDGTGNEIEQNLSNVLKLFRCLEKGAHQCVFYDPGIGTLSSSDAWARFKLRAKMIFGLATGWGLDENILRAYEFLVDSYEEGDRVYLFGFSRGAYTVRALAGMIYLIGLLPRDQKNLSPYGLVAYKRSADDNDLAHGWRFHRVSGARRVPIHFLGAWDTVSTVIVPRPDRFYVPSLQQLPYTRTNEGVRAFRHALAIDERRRMFRVNKWLPPERFNPNPFDDEDLGHTTKQVWFVGCHGDVGGGYPEERSGLAKLALKWMIDEAVAEGLEIKKGTVRHLVLGGAENHSKHDYVPPDPAADINQSLQGFWKVLENLPRHVKWREWPFREAYIGYYLPKGEPRPIGQDADIHPSIAERQAARDDYDPENLETRID